MRSRIAMTERESTQYWWTKLPLSDKMQKSITVIVLVLSNDLYSKWDVEKEKVNLFV